MAEYQDIAQSLSRITECCASLYLVLSDFEVVVSKENVAIARSDLAELESITEEKIAFGEKVKKHIRALKEAMGSLAAALPSVSINAGDDRQLSQFVAIAMDYLLGVHPELEIDLKIMDEWAHKLRSLRQDIFAKVETNAYLVKKLLEYHRETYAFWQAVARESEAVYGQSGKTKYGNSPQKSILNVRT